MKLKSVRDVAAKDISKHNKDISKHNKDIRIANGRWTDMDIWTVGVDHVFTAESSKLNRELGIHKLNNRNVKKNKNA